MFRFKSCSVNALACLGVIFLVEIVECVGLDGNAKAGRRREELDDKGRVVLEWELNEDQTEITFDLWAETTGFVGFGISPQGGMVGADIFVAGVGQDGAPYSFDRFAPANGEPREDKHADWTLLNASENATTTYLKFSRALYTCDEDEDYPIMNGTNRVIWAMGVTDDLEYHLPNNKGTHSVSLLAAVTPELNETGLMTWEGLLDMTMPAEDTSYWCSVHRGPEIDKKHYVVGFDALLPNEYALAHTHHFVLYECVLPEDDSVEDQFERLSVDNGFTGHPCFGDTTGDDIIPIQYCTSQMLYVWAKGGKRMVFPEDVAYPFGDDGVNKTRYILLEIHYDNPHKLDNLTYATGVQMFYTDKPRTHEAAQLIVMHGIDVTLMVPPNTTDFVVAGHCGSACTASKLSPDGISVFNVLLHSHLSGRKLKLRHFRGNVELPWLDYDDHYDFDYQQNKHLREAVQVLPGDHLTYECTYDSTWTGGRVVTGGLGTQNEMCEAFLWYYPKLDDLVHCGSNYIYEKSFEELGITDFNMTFEGLPFPIHYILEPKSLEGEFDDSMSFKFNWTEEFKKTLEEKRRFGDHGMQCSKDPAAPPEDSLVSYPKDFVEYVPKDLCASTGGPTTPGGSGTSPIGGSSAFVALSTIFISFLAATFL